MLQDNNAQQFQTACFVTSIIIIFVVITEQKLYNWAMEKKQKQKKM